MRVAYSGIANFGAQSDLEQNWYRGHYRWIEGFQRAKKQFSAVESCCPGRSIRDRGECDQNLVNWRKQVLEQACFWWKPSCH